MTRKRLYKIIMSYGYSPRQARQLTDLARRSGASYEQWEKAMKQIFLRHMALVKTERIIKKTKRLIVKAIIEIWDGMKVAAEAMEKWVEEALGT